MEQGIDQIRSSNLLKWVSEDYMSTPIEKYEMFLDMSYYDMWCVRCLSDRRFDSPLSFHFMKKEDAEEFKRLIELAQ